jgi:hypothetical protein
MTISCSGNHENKGGELLAGMEDISTVKPGGDLSAYYTKDTLAAARKYAGSHNDTEILDGLDRKIFAKNSRWHIISEQRNGDRARVELAIDAHPSPNMTGIAVVIPLKYESGRWKIDRADMIKKLSR